MGHKHTLLPSDSECIVCKSNHNSGISYGLRSGIATPIKNLHILTITPTYNDIITHLSVTIIIMVMKPNMYYPKIPKAKVHVRYIILHPHSTYFEIV